MDSSKTFLITGVSKGLGRALASAALAAGHRVVGTVRAQQDADEFEGLDDARAHARVLDVTDYDELTAVTAEVERTLGAIDVLVCNAGYGHEGPVEESSMEQLRQQFDVNVFGTVAAIKAVLPFMRARRSGHVIAVTSMGGLVAFPGIAFYNGSKFAVEGVLESLGEEVVEFGVRVTAVEPGAFRTDWAGRSMQRAPRAISDYDGVFDPIRERRLQGVGGQPGDPARAAEAILQVVEAEEPPAHLLLGTDALRVVREGRAAVDRDFEAWQKLSASTDFDTPAT